MLVILYFQLVPSLAWLDKRMQRECRTHLVYFEPTQSYPMQPYSACFFLVTAKLSKEVYCYDANIKIPELELHFLKVLMLRAVVEITKKVLA